MPAWIWLPPRARVVGLQVARRRLRIRPPSTNISEIMVMAATNPGATMGAGSTSRPAWNAAQLPPTAATSRPSAAIPITVSRRRGST